jgi:hypothetical protein
MPVLFVVFSNRPDMDEPLEVSIKENFPGNFFSMGRNRWLVVGEGTAREISDKLGITSVPQKISSGVVFAASGYFGRASSELWEWIAAKLGGHVIA